MSKSLSSDNQRAWFWALAAALVVAFWLLQAYVMTIVLATLIAYLFYPMYSWLKPRLKRQGLAIATTTLVSFLTIGIPVVLVVSIAVAQTVQFANDLNADQLIASGSSETVEVQLATATEQVNSWIQGIFGVTDAISTGEVVSLFQDNLPRVIKTVADSALSIASGIPNFITLLIIYVFVFVEVLANGKSLLKTAKRLSPFDSEVNNMYLSKIGMMAKAMVKGQMVIALAQGLASAAVLALLGFGEYFWFMAVLFTFLSFIPLGAGILTIPIGILFALFGNIWGAALILGNHFLVVTNIDNYIRPKVVPEEASLSPALTLMSAFAGVGYFGFLGVIYGPIIMIVVTSTIQAYLAHTAPQR